MRRVLCCAVVWLLPAVCAAQAPVWQLTPPPAIALIHDTAAKRVQVHHRGSEIQFAGVQAAEDQDFLHHPGHAASVSGDGLELLVAFRRLHLLKELAQQFG